jgi:hypothetical protein
MPDLTDPEVREALDGDSDYGDTDNNDDDSSDGGSDSNDTEYVLRGDDGEIIDRTTDPTEVGYDENDDVTGEGGSGSDTADDSSQNTAPTDPTKTTTVQNEIGRLQNRKQEIEEAMSDGSYAANLDERKRQIEDQLRELRQKAPNETVNKEKYLVQNPEGEIIGEGGSQAEAELDVRRTTDDPDRQVFSDVTERDVAEAQRGNLRNMQRRINYYQDRMPNQNGMNDILQAERQTVQQGLRQTQRFIDRFDQRQQYQPRDPLSNEVRPGEEQALPEIDTELPPSMQGPQPNTMTAEAPDQGFLYSNQREFASGTNIPGETFLDRDVSYSGLPGTELNPPAPAFTSPAGIGLNTAKDTERTLENIGFSDQFSENFGTSVGVTTTLGVGALQGISQLPQDIQEFAEDPEEKISEEIQGFRRANTGQVSSDPDTAAFLAGSSFQERAELSQQALGAGIALGGLGSAGSGLASGGLVRGVNAPTVSPEVSSAVTALPRAGIRKTGDAATGVKNQLTPGGFDETTFRDFLAGDLGERPMTPSEISSQFDEGDVLMGRNIPDVRESRPTTDLTRTEFLRDYGLPRNTDPENFAGQMFEPGPGLTGRIRNALGNRRKGQAQLVNPVQKVKDTVDDFDTTGRDISITDRVERMQDRVRSPERTRNRRDTEFDRDNGFDQPSRRRTSQGRDVDTGAAVEPGLGFALGSSTWFDTGTGVGLDDQLRDDQFQDPDEDTFMQREQEPGLPGIFRQDTDQRQFQFRENRFERQRQDRDNRRRRRDRDFDFDIGSEEDFVFTDDQETSEADADLGNTFAPSLTASLFNIRAEEEISDDETFTGLGIRPLQPLNNNNQ